MAWMRQQSEPENPAPQQMTPKTPSPEATIPATAPPRSAGSQSVATVGQSVQIKGELSAKENLTIEGKVEGKITLTDHNLTIGANGKITAEVHAKVVEVFGQVVGNITALDKVTLAPSGSVDGDITAPRISIADGARFKGKIDMEGSARPAAQSKPAFEPAKTTV